MGLIRSRKEALDEFSQAIAERFAEAPEDDEATEKAAKAAAEAAKRKAREAEAASEDDEGDDADPARVRTLRATKTKPKARPTRARRDRTRTTTGKDTPTEPEGEVPPDLEGGDTVEWRRRRGTTGKVERAGEVTTLDAATPSLTAGFDPGDGGPSHIGKPLGELLVERGLLTEEALLEALRQQGESGKKLGGVLVELGLVAERDLVAVLAGQLSMETRDLRKVTPDPELVEILPEMVARELGGLVLGRHGDRIEVAIADPYQMDLQQRLTEAIGEPVRIVLAPESDIRRLIEGSYKTTGRVDDAVRMFEARAKERRPTTDDSPVQTVDENAPAVQVVNLLLEQAVRDRASDVHIEPMEDRIRVRNRTDGALHEVLSLPISMNQSLVSRIKVMADLNIVERRRPQDGQIEVTVDGRELDVRVSTAATIHGEKVVMRLLDKSRALFKLGDLGMPDDTFKQFYELVRSPYGMVICAGPTGSGKTTTLYATLTEINSTEINIMTIEDPVEYTFPSVSQIQINEQAGITFATGLRSIMRQDPDAILVGEIRDVETARIAVQAALTGHLVLSSIHATDSTSALHRFLDMGIESFLIASSLLGVVAQRLVRRVCPHCKTPAALTAEEQAFWERSDGASGIEFVRGEGCNFCAHTGYLDRTGIYEVLHISPEMKQLIVENASHERFKQVAVEQGLITLREQAKRMVNHGETTVAEMMRVVYVL